MCKSVKLYFVCLMALILSGCGAGATSSDPLGTDSIAASASVTSLGTGQSSLITATVTNVTGNPVTGRSVSFAFRTNNSGGTLSVLNNETKGNGQAMVSYTAGANSPASSVEDTIQVSISNGSSAAVIITRTAGSGGGATSQISLLTASKPTLSASQNSIITAKVTDASGNPVNGETITFTIPIKNSGVPVLSAASAVTDGGGNAITIYTPGTTSPTSSVEDAIQASLSNGSTQAVIITRSGSASATASSIAALNASQTSVTGSQSAIITANVTDSTGKAISGETVTFTIPVKNSGIPTLSAASSVTDSQGNAITIYSPGIASPTSSVTDAIQASLSNGSTRALMITRTGTSVTTGPIISQLSATPAMIGSGHTSIIIAVVSKTAGNPVSGETVTFTMPVKNTGSPSLTSLTGTTDNDGKVVTVYSPGTASPTDSVDDAVQATITNGSSRAVLITRTAVTATSNTISISSSFFNDTVNAGSSAIITAQVKNASGNPVSGITVTFAIPAATAGSGAPFLSDLNKVTGGDGKAVTIYTAGATAKKTDVVTAAITGGDTALVMQTQ